MHQRKQGRVEFDYPAPEFGEEIQAEIARRVAEELSELRCDAVTALLAEILESKNAEMTVAAIAFAAGLPLLCGASQVELAARFKVTKQAFSRRVTEVSRRLGLRPSRAMRSESARETFRRKQLCKPKSKLSQALASLK
jgi:AraC-like DNA-binding protein